MKRSRLALLKFLACLGLGLFTAGLADGRPVKAVDIGPVCGPSAGLRASYRTLWADRLDWEAFGWDVAAGSPCPLKADEVCGKPRAPEFPADLPPYEAAAAAAAVTDFGYAWLPTDLPPGESLGPVPAVRAASADLGRLADDRRHAAGQADALAINEHQEGLAADVQVVASKPVTLKAASDDRYYGCGMAGVGDYGYPCGAACGCDEWETYACEHEYDCHPRYGACHTADPCHDDAANALISEACGPEFCHDIVRADLVEAETVESPAGSDLSANEDLRELLIVAARLVRQLSEAVEAMTSDVDRLTEEASAGPALSAPLDLPSTEPAASAERIQTRYDVEYLGL
jgi:hypothetical protein